MRRRADSPTQDATLAGSLLSADATKGAAADKIRELFEVTFAALRAGGTTFKDLKMSQSVTIPGVTDPRIGAKLGEVAGLWGDLQFEVAAVPARNAQERGHRTGQSLV